MKKLIVLIIVFGILAGCRPESKQIPTSVPLAAVPTLTAVPPATITSLPPTRDLNQLPPTTAPTPTLIALQTAAPTRALPTATPFDSIVTITDPDSGAMFTLGTAVTIRGLAQLPDGYTVWVTLFALNGQQLAEATAQLNELGWEATLSVPESVSGAAILEATVRTPAGDVVATDSFGVQLVSDTAADDRYLVLFNPKVDATAVESFLLFFDGEARRPVGSKVIISVWNENCQTLVARESFTLRGSGYWQGFVNIPRETAGPACAIANFGAPGSPGWREAQVSINILTPDDDGARGVHIANPRADKVVTAGQELFVNGTALNVEAGPVNVSVLLENGRVISQNVLTTDFFGYWEQTITLPAGISGTAQVVVNAGTPGDASYAEARSVFVIESDE